MGAPLTPSDAAGDLRTAITAEYQAIVTVVSDFDGRFMLIKGWSVTLSLAALGLGLIEQHYGLFLVAALSSTGFWWVEAEMKKHQLRYYARMRDIEAAAFDLNHQPLGGQDFSSPKIDWWWGFDGSRRRVDKPQRRTAANVDRLLSRASGMSWVLLPHAVAAVIGLVLFVLGLIGAPIPGRMPF
jgi:uncharacterized membrane protein